MAATTASLQNALEVLALSQAQLAEDMATLRRDYATLSVLVQGAQPSAATPKAEVAVTSVRTVDAPVSAEGRYPVGKLTTTRCPHVKARDGKPDRQCRQMLDTEGVCKWHGPMVVSPVTTAAAKTAAKPVAKPKADAKPKAEAAEGGPFTYVADATCKGTGKAGPCGGHFLNGKGYCKHHVSQATGRSVKPKASAPTPKPKAEAPVADDAWAGLTIEQKREIVARLNADLANGI